MNGRCNGQTPLVNEGGGGEGVAATHAQQLSHKKAKN